LLVPRWLVLGPWRSEFPQPLDRQPTTRDQRPTTMSWNEVCSVRRGMRITSLDDLRVFQLSRALADEISRLLTRPGFERDWELRRQIASSSARIPSQIAEGYGQRSDRHCAHFQSIARGSCNEMCAHLSVACGRGHISPTERDELIQRYVRIGKGLTRWIQYLEDRIGRSGPVADSQGEPPTDPRS
jgi:four helix bundle protein